MDAVRGDTVIITSFYDKVFTADGGTSPYDSHKWPELIGHELLIRNGKEYVYVGKDIFSFKMSKKILSFKADIYNYDSKSFVKQSETTFETSKKSYKLFITNDGMSFFSDGGKTVKISRLI